jgi:diguanylate cyclase (GGDEF)-like protein
MIAQALHWLASEATTLAVLAVAVAAVLGRARLVLLSMVLLGWLHGPYAQQHDGATVAAAIIALLTLLPEPTWRSPQAWLALAACAGLSGLAPAMPETLGPWPQPAFGSIAAWCLGTAALVGLARWIRGGAPFDLVYAMALLASGGLLLGPESLRPGWLAMAAAVILLGALWAARRVAYVDALTGLPNRRAFDERMQRLAGQAAVAMIDVDHFKRFNDRHGHEAGDRALRVVARQVRRVRGGSAFRYGGEEFAVLFEGRSVAEAEAALEQVREAVEQARVRLGPGRSAGAQAVRRGQGGELRVTVSMGLALRDGRRRSAFDVLKDADRALYRSKQAGRNRVTLAKA